MFGKLSIAAAVLALVPMISAGVAQAHSRDTDRVVAKRIIIDRDLYRERFPVEYGGWRNGFRGWRDGVSRYWYGGGPRRCVAVGKRRGGFGRAIENTRSVRFGPGFRACRKALRSCREKLRYRKAHGRNPFASCVVVSRRFHRY